MQRKKNSESPRFQARIAEAIANSITEFLPPLPPVAVSVSVGKEEKQKEQNKATQVEASGEVHSGKREGASRAADVKPAAKNGRPAPVKVSEGPSVREKTTVYRVQKRGYPGKKLPGNTRPRIGALLSLNHMKLRDPLYVNRVLKITGAPVEKKEIRG